MCIFGGGKDVTISNPNVIQPNVDNTAARKGSDLVDKKELLDEDSVADVAYGDQGKKTDPQLAKKTGSEQLKIDLNTGATGTGGGGISV